MDATRANRHQSGMVILRPSFLTNDFERQAVDQINVCFDQKKSWAHRETFKTEVLLVV